MKKKLMIIEDNYERFFVAKQLLEIKLKLNVKVVGAKDNSELAQAAESEKPSQVLYVRGGAQELLHLMEKRRVNKRNTEVLLVITNELEQDFLQNLTASVKSPAKMKSLADHFSRVA